MKRVMFHEDARSELMEAAHYYDARIPGLGRALIDDVELAINDVSHAPLAYSLVSSLLHRKILRRFPYSLLYVIEPDKIRIIGVAHHKRRPEYWRYRINLL